MAIGVDRRSAGGREIAEKRAASRFLDFRGGAALLPDNNTTTSLDGLDVEPVPGLYGILDSRSSGEDVRAYDAAAGNQ